MPSPFAAARPLACASLALAARPAAVLRPCLLAAAAALHLWLADAGLTASLAAGACAALLSLASRRRPVVDAALAAATLGGLGMTIGAGLDAAGAGHVHAGGAGTLAPVGWSTALMLLFCLAGCAWGCPATEGLDARVLRIFASLAGMAAGMGAAALALPSLAPGAQGAGAHAAMVVAMAAGAAGGTSIAIAFASRRRSFVSSRGSPST